ARLAAEPEVALSRETLMADVWDENWFGSTKTLDVHIAALRRKIADSAAGGAALVPRIVTLRGHGYRLELGGPAEEPRRAGGSGSRLRVRPAAARPRHRRRRAAAAG